MTPSRIAAIAAMVISIVAGIEIIFVSFVLAIAGGYLSQSSGGIGAIFGIIGMAWGILIIVSACLMYLRKEKHVLWGALVIVFSIASIFGALGGFLLGLILGVIGGILGILSSPGKENIGDSDFIETSAR